jgi:uncharacterized protein (DUF736 family)
MGIIAVLKPTKEGGWEGAIRTLSINRAVRLVPNEDRASDAAPIFRVLAGKAELGVVWPKRTGRSGKSYFPVKLDDPGLPHPISATLFEQTPGDEAHLVWNRRTEMEA